MNPHDTALLKKAADRGLAVHHGKYMLEAQIEMFRKFFGLPAVANSSGLDLNMRSTERCHQP
jgi:shikimate dehydrogenase